MRICKKAVLPILATGILSSCVNTSQQTDRQEKSSLFYKQPYKVLGTRGGVVPYPKDEPSERPEKSSSIVTPVAIETPIAIERPAEPVIDNIPEPMTVMPDPVELEKYTVKKGDSLWRVAKMYSVSIAELAEVNNFPKDRKLKIKEVILIPESGVYRPLPKRNTSTRKSTTSTAKTTKPKVGSSSVSGYRPPAKMAIPADGKYTVQKGDSLWLISSKFGVSIDEIRAWNDLKGSSIFPGKVLVLKDGLTQPSASSQPERHSQPPVPRETTTPQPPVELPIAPTLPSELDTAIDPTQPASTLVQPELPPAVSQPAAVETNSNIFMDEHIVQPNDTLQSIADLFAIKEADIKKANPGVDFSKIKSGDVIQVPIDMGATQ